MTSAENEIEKMWQVFELGAVFELRALWPAGLGATKLPIVRHFHQADFESVEGMQKRIEATARQLNADGYNIYAVMNPICQGFQGKSATDQDISYRDLLLIDIDRAGDTKSPADESEIEAAKALASQILAYLTGLGWPAPVKVMSGNGVHLYYILDRLENNHQSQQKVREVLSVLADKFDNDVAKIDRTVFNASRITKVPGTVMRKGVESANRPYRMAVVCDE